MNIMYHHVWIFQYTLVESTVGFLFAAGHGSSWTVVNAQMDHDGPLGINMGWPEDIVIGYLKIEYSSCSLYKIVVFGGPHCIDTAMIHSCPASVCCRGVPLHMHWHVIEPVFLAAIAFFSLEHVNGWSIQTQSSCWLWIPSFDPKSQIPTVRNTPRFLRAFNVPHNKHTMTSGCYHP